MRQRTCVMTSTAREKVEHLVVLYLASKVNFAFY